MDARHLLDSLTAGDQDRFDRDGYLVIPAALSRAEVTTLTEASQAVIRSARPPEPFPERHDGSGEWTGARLIELGEGARQYEDILGAHDSLVALLDHPATFPKVCGILGWNIHLYHAILVLTPPTPGAGPELTFGWHQDSSRVNAELEGHPRPRLSVKVAYYLTDVSQPGCANTWIVPGSHRQDELPRPAGGYGQPAGAIPVCVPAGGALLFDRRLWHAATPNWSDITRVTLFYGYSYRWLQLHESMTLDGLRAATADPVRWQLLGGCSDSTGRYAPEDSDVPLRQLLAVRVSSGAGA